MAVASGPSKLDMNAVWARAIVLIRENLQLLGLLAGVFILLPSAFLNFALPSQEILEGPMNVVLDPASSEEAKLRATEAIASAAGPFLAWGGIVQVIQHVGYAAMMALVGRNRPTVGGAILQAAKSILPIVIAFTVYLVGMYALLAILPLVLMPLGAVLAAFAGAVIGVIALLFITSRLTLTMPAIVIEGELNPFKALMRSWRITGRSAGNVFGFWMLLVVAYCVILLIVSVAISLLTAMVGQGTGATLIGGLLSGVFASVSGTLVSMVAVAMHVQLADPTPNEIASDFE